MKYPYTICWSAAELKRGEGEKFATLESAMDFMESEVGVNMKLYKGKVLIANFIPYATWKPTRAPEAAGLKKILASRETQRTFTKWVRTGETDPLAPAKLFAKLASTKVTI